jgi:hypothetical protein
VTPREIVIFSMSRSRRSRANPISIAADRKSRCALTTTSSSMNPMTMASSCWSAVCESVVSASTPRRTSGCSGE